MLVRDEINNERVCPERNLESCRRLAGCFTAPGGTPPDGCECYDSDADGDVDLVDFGAFQVSFVGEL